MRLALLGFGLIGGSIARALHSRAPGEWRIAAWSPSGDGPRAAQANGEIEVAASTPAAALDGADLVVLAAPPLECLALLDDLSGGLRSKLAEDAVLTDVASSKVRLVDRAAEHGLRFVGGHPMAGRELTGYGAADPDLFVSRPWVTCTDGGDETARRRVADLATAVGAQPVEMEAATHDAAVAGISHLPLVVSAALVESVFGPLTGTPAVGGAASRLAASGWRDMTRLAKGDVMMGAGIAATNAGELAIRIHELRDVLAQWLVELERDGGPDADALAAKFGQARDLLLKTTEGKP